MLFNINSKRVQPAEPKKVHGFRWIPEEALTPTPEADGTIISSKAVEQFFASVGVLCDVVNTTSAPQLVRYDLVLDDITQVGTKTKKAAEFFSKRFHAPAVIADSDVGDIALEVAKATRSARYLDYGVFYDGFIDTPLTTCALGEDTCGESVRLTIADAPHVLIAGTTGSGKSVLMNSIINSILVRENPAQVRFVMIDPKKVELSRYNGLPHLLCPVVTEVPDAVDVLKKLVQEMEWRYQVMAQIGVKEISQTKCARIICFIDELADLMITSGKEVESLIVRIAQLGRAAGIHLVVATQRPSVKVVTGLIKANIPCKIALTVANTTDSMVILDHGGAEKLTGRGDAIIKRADCIHEVRFQSYYTPEQDIDNIIKHWKDECDGIRFLPHDMERK